MFTAEFSIYLSEENDRDFLGFKAENNLFIIFDIVNSNKENCRQFLHEIVNVIGNKGVSSLTSFEELLSETISKANLSLNFSLSAGYLFNNKLYLKTYNDAEVHIKRDGKAVKIIGGNSSASGFIKENDLIIFSTKNFNDNLGGIERIKKFTQKARPHEIVEVLTPQLKAERNEKAIALLVSFQKKSSEDFMRMPLLVKKPFFDKIKEDFFRLNNQPGSLKKKKLTLIFLAIILIILVWSVGFGVQRRLEAQEKKRIIEIKQAVEKKLSEADETAFLDLAKATSLISLAKTEANKIDNSLSKKYKKETEEIKKLISSQESKLLNKEEKNYQEFYDLAIETSDVDGKKLYLDGSLLTILDNKKGVVYTLTLDKKAPGKRISPDFKKAKLVAEYDGAIFSFIPEEGITKLNDDKRKKIINNDKDWKEVIDMKIYNGNIYLLDKGNNEIYKYLVTENEYSSKQPYFIKGSSVDLSDAKSMAIDSAIYIGFSDYIAKYTSGIRDEFKTNFPDNKLSFTKIFTNKELDKIYVWDKDNGVIYILSKKGIYEKQIRSSIIPKALDFVVFENVAYFLANQKIYKIAL